ncbi:MAG TPA: Asp-tRNA(Asn)/Glu-tRNA(Gln) amidotransferase subunit GatC [Clostridia bacterium]|nr:Asp-tRNA(Asn)/Glu-tRNA(Gln) amidotransferase subunit GatC [Clostridia bacterium]
MAINKEIIDYVATLARLQLSEEEQEAMVAEIGKVVNYFDQLKELDTAQVNAMDYLVVNENVFEDILRDDVTGTSFAREELLHPDEDRSAAFFTVPKVVE